ncbi:MAG TPA: hypothetical protein VEX36_00360 [Thermoleophilaceae bacterium]|nr:hypothetical protein [Thermoleophilaceae bacterium]
MSDRGVAAPRDDTSVSPSLPLLLAIAVYIAATYSLLLLDRGTFDPLIQEDGIVEWVGTLGFLVASGCFLAAFLLTRRTENRSRYTLVKRLSLLALALLLFVFAGEEISWGQRLLGLETPESLQTANVQSETNLHNLDLLQNTLSVDRLFQMFWIGLGVLVPLLAAFWPRARRLLDRALPIFPLSVALLFVFSQALEVGFQSLLDGRSDLYNSTYPIGSATVEILESNVGLLLGLGAVAVLRSLRQEADAFKPEGDAPIPVPADVVPTPA